jgi:phosphoadenosine phosphosulfate reductase
MQERLQEIAESIKGLKMVEALRYLTKQYPGKVAFSTSFGWEDQVITQLIAGNKLSIRIFTLDTGRNFPETYSTWNATRSAFEVDIEAFYPENFAVGEMLKKKGPLSFYESVDNRKECCFIRKVEPLKRALANTAIWITGIRAEQSDGRKEMQNLEWDDAHNLIKFHPLFSWTLDEVKAYINTYHIPYNPLHDKGFPSIGCQPCTRAVKPGESFRAGRWWWEDSSKKECGLHNTSLPPQNFSI